MGSWLFARQEERTLFGVPDYGEGWTTDDYRLWRDGESVQVRLPSGEPLIAETAYRDRVVGHDSSYRGFYHWDDGDVVRLSMPDAHGADGQGHLLAPGRV